MITVVIADDQALVRGGFAAILESQPGIEVVGQAADGDEAVQVALEKQPDVVLMDIRMPGTDGIEATRRLVDRAGVTAPRVLVLTTFDVDDYVFDAFAAGASGFLLKDVHPSELAAAVHAVARGGTLLSPTLTRRLIEQRLASRPNEAAQRPAVDLTARETQVLELMARGLSNAEIAARLFLSHATVKTHVARILGKVPARDRVQAVVFAYEAGLVRPGAPGAR